MAKIRSSIKRIKTNERNRVQNHCYNSQVKTFTKQYFQALNQYEISSSTQDKDLLNLNVLLALVYSKIDKAKKKHIFHKNTAARKKAKLGKAFSKIVYKK